MTVKELLSILNRYQDKMEVVVVYPGDNPTDGGVDIDKIVHIEQFGTDIETEEYICIIPQ